MTDIASSLRRLMRVNRPLTFVGVVMLATLVGTLVGLVLDPRLITASPAWLKPMKFAISTSIYAFTFVWLLGFLRGHVRLVALIGNVVAVGLAVEVVIIVLQVVRGTTSHFNFATPLDATLFVIMAALIMVVWLLNAGAMVLLIRQRLDDPAYAWSLRLGLVLAVLGMGVAFFMTQPTSAQLGAAAGGAAPTIVGAHSVGVPDGGPGLPIVGWSTVGGDLRVAHFFGLHALQVLPILSWLLLRRTQLDVRRRLGLVWTAGASYFGLIVLLTWQALRGQSVVAPDGISLAFGGALLGATLVATIATLTHSTREPASQWSVVSGRWSDGKTAEPIA